MSAARDLIGRRVLVLVSCFAVATSPARAQVQMPPAADLGKFLFGGAVALAMHEGGHVVTDVMFGAAPGIKKVSFAGIPFFAITHDTQPAGQEFVISSAGFWVQESVDEILLTRRPDLRAQPAPLLKGMLAFNTLASAAYAAAAFARVGPDERDTRGIAASARLAEPWIGVTALAPAAFDIARYYQPRVRWLRWASRASKAAGVLLIVRAAQDAD